MKTSLFIAVILFSGALAGLSHGLVNLMIVEPFLDSAISIENQNLFKSGEEKDTPEFWANYYSYRVWQKGGEVLAGTILGTAMGALFGIVFGLARHVLPSKNFVKKALVLSLIMWAALYVIPFAKYPANPPTVGDPETIVLRQTMYVVFVAISGLGALGFYQIYKRIGKKTVAFVGYAALICTTYFLMPQNPDPVIIDDGLLLGFRLTSMVGMSVFWTVVALVLGTLWQKMDLERVSQSKYQ
jgi:hypothetical protein